MSLDRQLMKIFISYAYVDKDVVLASIIEILSEAGHEVWYDNHLYVGKEWEQQLIIDNDSNHTGLIEKYITVQIRQEEIFMYRLIIYIMTLTTVLFLPTTNLAQNSVEAHCGDIIEAELAITPRFHSYTLQVSGGTKLNIGVTPIGVSLNPLIALIDSAGNIIAQENMNVAGELEFINNFIVSSSDPEIVIIGDESNSKLDTYTLYNIKEPNIYLGKTLGLYQLSIGCTLRDGTVIEPTGNYQPQSSETISPRSPELFTGFGFPGLSSVDFSAGIEIPIQAGQSQTAPVGGDIVTLYTYDAIDESTATLSLSRVSGDVSVGVAVIKQDTNEIVFVVGMPSSNNLSVELTFPSDGTYAIGLFQMITSEHSDTSGAVQVSIE